MKKRQKSLWGVLAAAGIAVAGGAAVGMLAGCGNTTAEQTGEHTDETEDRVTAETETAHAAVETETAHAAVETAGMENTENTTAEAFSFADVAEYEFWFGSGAGGWSTVLYVDADGTFEGQYHDADMGDQRYYLCDFSGSFTEPVKVNDYTYSVELKQITYEQEPGKEEPGDEMTVVYTEPYGLDDAKELFFYLPGAPVKELPEDYQSWMGGYGDEIGEELPFYGLYNESGEQGFSSHKRYTIEDELAYVEQMAAELTEQLRAEATTQIEMTDLSGQIYRLWDDELNSIWLRLKEKLDEDEMQELTQSERDWIAYKDAEIKKEGDAYGMGSLRATAENERGAELTRERVYELAEYLQKTY